VLAEPRIGPTHVRTGERLLLPTREDAARNWVDLAGWCVKRLRLLHALKNEAAT
jgi:hypothetical protein